MDSTFWQIFSVVFAAGVVYQKVRDLEQRLKVIEQKLFKAQVVIHRNEGDEE